MKQVVESLRNSQNPLVSALDGHDSDAIFQASKDLSNDVARLSTLKSGDLDYSLRPILSEVDELMQASIYRLRFLRDHSSSRLQLLSGWRVNQADTYSNAARDR